MKRKTQGKCPECGSTLVIDAGQIICTQDLLETEYPKVFREWDTLPQWKLVQLEEQVSFKVYDMYQRWKIIDEKGNRPEFCCTYNPNIEFNPMTQSEMILPDTFQVMIAEKRLKRPLTPDEYYGIVKVPLINESGEKYQGQIDQLVFPRDFTTKGKRQGDEKIEFRVVFDYDLL